MCFSWLTLTVLREDVQTEAFRGSKSRNKVSVGEPAEGSLKVLIVLQCAVENLTLGTCRLLGRLGSSRLSCLTTLVTQLQIWPADRFVGLAIWLWLSFGPGLLSRRRPPTALSCDLPLDGLSSC